MNLGGSDWEQALEQLEQEVEAVRLALAADDAPLPTAMPYGPPTRPASPLPPELAARATALLDSLQLVEAELSQRLAATARELHVLDRMRPGREPSAACIDQAM